MLLHLFLVHPVDYAVGLASPWIQFLRVYHDVAVDDWVQHVLFPLGLVLLLLLPLLVRPRGSR